MAFPVDGEGGGREKDDSESRARRNRARAAPWHQASGFDLTAESVQLNQSVESLGIFFSLESMSEVTRLSS